MARVFGIDNKYQLIMIIIISFFVVIVALAIILSNVHFEEKVDGTIAKVVNEGDLVVNYIDGDEIEFNDKKEHTYSISITNTSSAKLYYSVYLTEANVEEINVRIEDKNGKVVNEISNILDDKLINLDSIEGGETIRYIVIFDNDRRINFEGLLKVDNDSLSSESFADLILLNNNVVAPKTRVGSEIATTNEGLISMPDNKGTSYYFRGNVDNNFVKIGDLMYRIVRINGDGTIRIVLDGVLDETRPYNTNSLAVGTNASSLTLLESSSLISYLNSWYEENLRDYSEFLTVGDYCTDTTFNNNINGIVYSSAYERIFEDKNPNLYCNGNIYSGKIGLLSVDEVVLAGASGNVPNTSYYLYNKDIPGNYVTSSSYFINPSNNVAMVNIMSNGAIGDGVLVTNVSYIRPVIQVGISAKVKGNGTSDDPYIIVS
ncbi:MAG TPA: hypothetical protein IAC02_06910 [Candidatus Coprovivens excrementavium]|nr:hypothetical protein [Candidatus Coprovivens excrementavium]